MELNQSTLRGILAQILSVDESFIVPKQGNWYNPQEADTQPDTWCAYIIKSNTPRSTPFYSIVSSEIYVCVEKIATIQLQFVGNQSEELASSVANWTFRNDVKEAFESVQGSIMYSTNNAISSIFSQDGNNTVLAWNVDFQVLWVSMQKSNIKKIPTVELEGEING